MIKEIKEFWDITWPFWVFVAIVFVWIIGCFITIEYFDPSPTTTIEFYKDGRMEVRGEVTPDILRRFNLDAEAVR